MTKKRVFCDSDVLKNVLKFQIFSVLKIKISCAQAWPMSNWFLCACLYAGRYKLLAAVLYERRQCHCQSFRSAWHCHRVGEFSRCQQRQSSHPTNPSSTAQLAATEMPPDVSSCSLGINRTTFQVFSVLSLLWQWLNGLVFSTLGTRALGPQFDSRFAPLFHLVATLDTLFTHVASPVSQLQETGVRKREFAAPKWLWWLCAKLSWALR